MAVKRGNYKCAICKQQIKSDEESLPYQGRFAHKTCFNELMRAGADEKRKEQAEKSLQRKAAKKAKDKNETNVITVKTTTKDKSPEEIADEKSFVSYITELTGHKPDVKSYTLAKKFINEWGVKYADIVAALKYFYEIKENPYIAEKFSLGIVPYVIEDARKYYEQLDEAIKRNQEIDSSSFYENKVVSIKSGKRNRKGTIDITKLNEG